MLQGRLPVLKATLSHAISLARLHFQKQHTFFCVKRNMQISLLTILCKKLGHKSVQWSVWDLDMSNFFVGGLLISWNSSVPINWDLQGENVAGNGEEQKSRREKGREWGSELGEIGWESQNQNNQRRTTLLHWRHSPMVYPSNCNLDMDLGLQGFLYSSWNLHRANDSFWI